MKSTKRKSILHLQGGKPAGSDCSWAGAPTGCIVDGPNPPKIPCYRSKPGSSRPCIGGTSTTRSAAPEEPERGTTSAWLAQRQTRALLCNQRNKYD